VVSKIEISGPSGQQNFKTGGPGELARQL